MKGPRRLHQDPLAPLAMKAAEVAARAAERARGTIDEYAAKAAARRAAKGRKLSRSAVEFLDEQASYAEERGVAALMAGDETGLDLIRASRRLTLAVQAATVAAVLMMLGGCPADAVAVFIASGATCNDDAQCSSGVCRA